MSKPSVPHDVHPVDPAERRRVFTIHLRATEPWHGRVIHAASGAAAHFTSMAELEAFVRRVLAGDD